MHTSDPIACGLPHREPFVFVETVCALEPGRLAICTKRFAASEPFFRGHFPNNPLVPGVILTEALAQTAGIAAGQPANGKSYRLSAIKLMKFLKSVPPETEVRFQAKKSGGVGGLLQFEVVAKIAEDVVAEGVIVLSEA
jgi:3-hydroxyacyl-[acyl-carrier-protein] dehydratase